LCDVSLHGQPRITKEELLRRVDRSVLEQKHHVNLRALDSVFLGILISVDEVSPAAPTDSDLVTVRYTVTNFTLQQGDGIVAGRAQGHDLVAADGTPPRNLDLAPGTSVTGLLRVSAPLQEGHRTILLSYRDRESCQMRPGPKGRPIEVCIAGVTANTSAEIDVVRDLTKVDSDNDGVTDLIETQLLRRFRPFYRFSKNNGSEESNRPADALWFVQRSDLYDHQTETDNHPVFSKATLATTPSLVLEASTIGAATVDARSQRTEYYLNLSNEFRSGEPDWERIKAEATGLYGHVTRLREDSTKPEMTTGYKIEYWQFYAFDPVPGQIDCYRGSDSHEGDWEGVELVVEEDLTTIRRVRHLVHSADVVFDLSEGTRVDIGGNMIEFQGKGALRPYTGYIDLNVKGPAGIGWAQNNLVRFYCDVEGCTHPVVHIEHGGHASWPTEHWDWPDVASHAGDFQAYLVATPPNLGEIGRPNRDCPSCVLAIEFNGHWGACGGDPPQGPSLHWSWGTP